MDWYSMLSTPGRVPRAHTADEEATRRYASDAGGVGNEWVMPGYGPPVAAPPSVYPPGYEPARPYAAAERQYYGDLDSVNQGLFQANPELAWRQLIRGIAGNDAGPLARYLQSIYGRAYADYNLASMAPGANDLRPTEYFAGHADQYRQQFQDQSARARGEDFPAPVWRFLGSV